MKEFSEKLQASVLTDEELQNVAGGASTSGRMVECPVCKCQNIYKAFEEFYFSHLYVEHTYQLIEMGLLTDERDSDHKLKDYAKLYWDQGTPAQ